MKKISGKVLGAVLGLAAGGPLGAALGVIIGHVYDKHPEDNVRTRINWTEFSESYTHFAGTAQQATFTIGVIVLGAKMAKADGRVTREEVEAFKRVFNIKPEQEDQVGKIFNRARMSADGFEPYALQLAAAFRRNSSVLEQVLGGLFIIAASDSAGLSSAEIVFLKRVAAIFGFGEDDFSRIAARSGVTLPGAERKAGGELRESYEILGVQVEATPEQIKIAYRALIREYHPDRLVAQGMAAEFVASANEKMKRINVAYDTVCKARGIK